ncbi:MAG: hypothetical protein AB8G14_00750 [Ilumatobacter sp.]
MSVAVAPWVRRFVALAVVCPFVAAALVFTASFVPDRLILGELSGAANRIEMTANFQVGISGRPLDTFSDCIALTMGLGDTEGGPATIWVRSPTLGSCNGAIASVQSHAAGEGLQGGYEYYRYWHGYTFMSRPLVATVGVSGQRMVLLWAVIGAVALLGRRLWHQHGALASVALLGPFLLTTDTIELTRSIPHGTPALVAVAGAWWLHRLSGSIESAESVGEPGLKESRSSAGRSNLAVASGAFVVGSAYVFVDLLTTPPGAWALSTGVVALSSAGFLHGRALLLRTVLASAAWIAGWVWTWVAKWAIAMLVLGYSEVRANVGGAVEDRVAGERDYIDLSWFNSIDLNIERWMSHPLTPPVLIAIVVVSALVARRQEFASTWATRLLIASPAVLPLIWFEVMRNHSLVHAFVFRSLGVTAGLVAVALIVPSSAIARGSSSDVD